MRWILILAIPGLLGSVFSIKKMVVNSIGDAGFDGGGIWMLDSDPELVNEAISLGFKMNESLLEASHPGFAESLK